MQGNLMSRRNFVGAAAATAATVAAFSLTGGGSNGSSDAKSDAKEDKAETKALSGTITAVGSTALQPLCEAAAEQFMEKNSGVQITVQGGGSGQGITQITQGAVQIGNSDVFAEAKVKDTADLEKIADNKVCIVGMGPIVNKDVTVDDLTIDQLKSIFTGEVTNWKEVGGADAAITVINRASGSGTRATFEAAVLGDTKVPDTFKPQEQDSSGTAAEDGRFHPGRHLLPGVLLLRRYREGPESRRRRAEGGQCRGQLLDHLGLRAHVHRRRSPTRPPKRSSST